MLPIIKKMQLISSHVFSANNPVTYNILWDIIKGKYGKT